MDEGEAPSAPVSRRRLYPGVSMCVLVRYLCSSYRVHSLSSERHVLKESTWLKVQLVDMVELTRRFLLNMELLNHVWTV